MLSVEGLVLRVGSFRCRGSDLVDHLLAFGLEGFPSRFGASPARIQACSAPLSDPQPCFGSVHLSDFEYLSPSDHGLVVGVWVVGFTVQGLGPTV